MSRTVNKYDLNNGKVLEITNYELLEGVVFKKIYISNVEFSEGTEFVVNVEQGNLLMDYPREFYAVYLESSKRRGVALQYTYVNSKKAILKALDDGNGFPKKINVELEIPIKL